MSLGDVTRYRCTGAGLWPVEEPGAMARQTAGFLRTFAGRCVTAGSTIFTQTVSPRPVRAVILAVLGSGVTTGCSVCCAVAGVGPACGGPLPEVKVMSRVGLSVGLSEVPQN